MKYLKVILIPILFALILRVLFGASLFDNYLSVMTWTFFILVPLAIGALTIYYSSIDKARSILYRIFAPWLPILIVITLTILISHFSYFYFENRFLRLKSKFSIIHSTNSNV